MEPRNRFQGMNSASLCGLAGRYDNPIPPRFLTPIDSLKIPALETLTHLSQGQGVAVLGPAHVEGLVFGVAAAPQRAGRDLTVVRLHPAHRTVLRQHQVLNSPKEFHHLRHGRRTLQTPTP
jgi:hypothetical protein